jgi:hypothetical protein
MLRRSRADTVYALRSRRQVSGGKAHPAHIISAPFRGAYRPNKSGGNCGGCLITVAVVTFAAAEEVFSSSVCVVFVSLYQVVEVTALARHFEESFLLCTRVLNFTLVHFSLAAAM